VPAGWEHPRCRGDLALPAEKSERERHEGTGDHSYMSEFGHIDKSSEVFEVRTFVVEFAKVVML
jgi:hypothetical protein